MTHLINQLISYEAVCRTAPATPGLSIIDKAVCRGGVGGEYFEFLGEKPTFLYQTKWFECGLMYSTII
jgi:hypothetical protein